MVGINALFDKSSQKSSWVKSNIDEMMSITSLQVKTAEVVGSIYRNSLSVLFSNLLQLNWAGLAYVHNTYRKQIILTNCS